MKSDPFTRRIGSAAKDMDCLPGDDNAGSFADRDGTMSIDLLGEFSPRAEDHFHVGMPVRLRVHGFCRSPSRDAGNPPQPKLVGGDPSVDMLVAVFAHNT